MPGLTPYLEKLGFGLVGYGCTTCIGNSGPLIEEVASAVDEGDLNVVAVLSGNRNFEGRIHPQVRASYLASPPLVVAYALAGRVDVDLTTEPIATGPDGPVYLRDLWPAPEEIVEAVGAAIDLGAVLRRVRADLRGRRPVACARHPERFVLRLGWVVDLRPGAAVLRTISPRGATATSRAPGSW